MKKQISSIIMFNILLFAGSQLLMAQENSVSSNANPKDTIAVLKVSPKPLITSIFTADPSAHIFNGKLYIYPSHDIESNLSGANGGHYDMKDYHVLTLNKIGGEAVDNGVGLALSDIPWAGKQLWAPDAAYKNGTYYLYFPAKDKNGIFRIGVAVGNSPTGPFKAEPQPLKDSFSIDPCVFKDNDGSFYMYFGGLSGGQLQNWVGGTYDASMTGKEQGKDDQPAFAPKIARLKNNMLEFDETPKDVIILDEGGKPILAVDHNRRFFEGAWTYKYKGKYYFTYSTGDTHQICYAIGSSPYGPFTYRGVILKPVKGWTTHESIIAYQGKWYMFYHDTELSGKNSLRNVKVTELHYLPNGDIETITPQ